MEDIYLIRHGETEWNVKEVFRGRLDVELNDTGRQQAALLAEYLARVEIAVVYSSPLRRALDTARAVATPHNLSIQVTPALADMDFGEWQGIPVEEVQKKYPKVFQEWATHPERVRIPGGETLEDVRKRAVDLVMGALTKYEGKKIVLVTHRVVNKLLICALLGLDNSHFWSIKQDTAALSTFSHDRGRFTLTEHNNTCYLKPLQLAKRRDF